MENIYKNWEDIPNEYKDYYTGKMNYYTMKVQYHLNMERYNEMIEENRILEEATLEHEKKMRAKPDFKLDGEIKKYRLPRRLTGSTYKPRAEYRKNKNNKK